MTPPAQATSSAPVTYRTIFSRAHMLLQTLLSLFPTLPQTLPTHLLRRFPHKSHNTTSHTVYCRNLVEMMEYCPQVAESVLGLLVERAIGIDVEVQVELEELEELISSTNESTSAVQNGLLNNLDPFDNLADDASSSDSDSGSEAGDDVEIENFSDVSSEAEGDDDAADKPGNEIITEKEANRRAKRLREMVAKLDSIMGLLLSWLQKTSINGPIDGESNQHPHFGTMMGIFDRTVLTTFKSRYTQFLIFYLVSLPSFPTLSIQGTDQESVDPVAQPNPHADIFLGLLLHNTLIPQEPPIPMLTRIASASYLASFISRGLCVGKEECRGAVTVCCQWITEHLAGLELLVRGKGDSTPTSQEMPQGSGYTELGVFYAISQALFLIFCFRWRDLVENGKQEEEEDEEEEEGHRRRWIRPLDIVQRLVISPLNPLKICSPNVVHQFARISQKVGFVYCQSIIESNRRASKLALSSATTPNTPSSVTPSLHAGGINPWDTAQSSAAMKDLQAFFPFDPYRLPNSKKWLDGMYREWSMVALDDDDEDEDDSDEEESENEQEDQDVQAGSDSEADEVSHGLQQDDSDEEEKEDYVPMELGSVRDGLSMAESFGKMSISPIPGGIHRQMGKRRGT